MAQVFVVDDDPEVVDLLVWVLRQEGYQTVGYSVAEEALSAAKNQQPDLVLVDLLMPGIGGVEFCQELKGDPRTSHVRVVFLSGYGYLEREAAGAGADHFMAKPFNLDEVTRCVADQIGPGAGVAQG